VGNWVNAVTKDILDVPHLHITMTTDDSLRPFFRRERRLLKELLRVAALAVQEVIEELYPGIELALSTPCIPSAVTWVSNPMPTL
jgi:hypothetical protein